MNTTKWKLIAGFTVIAVLATWFAVQNITGMSPSDIISYKLAQNSKASTEKFHEHFDLGIYLNDHWLDLSDDKYQSTTYEYKDAHVHLHDKNGKVVHLHEPDITLTRFLNSVGMNLSDTCFTDDQDMQYCQAESNRLLIFANGELIESRSSYVPNDLDRITIYYGSDTDETIQSLTNEVSDEACIYSLKCKERGEPPPEQCTSSIESPCSI